MSDTRECGGDVAAYVLGALEPDEVSSLRAHLATCAHCRQEVASLQLLTGALAESAPRYPTPASLRRRVLRTARSEPKTSTAHPRPARPGWPARAAGALLAAAIVVVGVAALAGGGSNASRVIQASVHGTAGSAELRVSSGRGDLIVAGLPPPQAGRIYEVWLQHGNAAPSPTATLFSVTSTGSADVGLPESLHGVNRVLVTSEPAGGSRAPTRAPVIVAQLS
jgi:anti-sigma-K factor RskA